ncbi:hypothetical protein N7456_010296 [Penicillium angulare]|uniref:Uncharacterized protein n=1 Tax=Penicillium angulare TaxID=116970 RepID=A0A9W9F6I2_9EURO|nr:hypothetical protein N7456_010296 [Penicillium angulare]
MSKPPDNAGCRDSAFPRIVRLQGFLTDYAFLPYKTILFVSCQCLYANPLPVQYFSYDVNDL